MGSAVSAGSDNEELTNNLCNADYIRTPRIEKLFRAVDRGEYILPEHRMNAYKDQAWRSNNLHMSAPCIYSEVLEGLDLRTGMSFLNLGSGTGYLSTLAGLILGSTGLNHGVEYYDDVIQYANKKLEDFKRYSGAMDEFDFCEPKFMQGNCLCLTSERRYDRVYVGAACPVPFDGYLKDFIKVGGLLVMPFHDQLLQVRRQSELSWETVSLLPVSFATLIMPKEDCKETLKLMEINPESLQSLCRSKIRSILRANVQLENPELSRPVPRKTPRKMKLAYRPPAEKVIRVSAECDHSDCSSDDDDDDDQPIYQEGVDLSAMTWADITAVLSNERLGVWRAEHMFAESSNAQSSSSVANATTDAVNDEAPNAEMASSQVACNRESTTVKTDQQRRKFDSGLGEEESTDDEPAPQEQAQQSKRCRMRLFKWSKNDTDCNSSSTCSCDTIEVDNERNDEVDEPANKQDDADDSDDDVIEREDLGMFSGRRTVDSPYTPLMCKKISELPLPPTLKNFLNFYRFHLNLN